MREAGTAALPASGGRTKQRPCACLEGGRGSLCGALPPQLRGPPRGSRRLFTSHTHRFPAPLSARSHLSRPQCLQRLRPRPPWPPATRSSPSHPLGADRAGCVHRCPRNAPAAGSGGPGRLPASQCRVCPSLPSHSPPPRASADRTLLSAACPRGQQSASLPLSSLEPVCVSPAGLPLSALQSAHHPRGPRPAPCTPPPGTEGCPPGLSPSAPPPGWGPPLSPALAALLVQAFPEAPLLRLRKGRRSPPCSARHRSRGGLSRLWAALGPAPLLPCASRTRLCLTRPTSAVDSAPRGQAPARCPPRCNRTSCPVVSCSARVTDEVAESRPGHRSVCGLLPASSAAARWQFACALTHAAGRRVCARAPPWPAGRCLLRV